MLAIRKSAAIGGLSRICSAVRSLSTSADEGGTMTGTVKFYIRSKAYGFIRPDEDGGGDVFVHRKSIISTEDPDKSLFYPFLRTGERVRFTAEDVGKEQPLARNVTFEDGSVVPTVRAGVSGTHSW